MLFQIILSLGLAAANPQADAAAYRQAVEAQAEGWLAEYDVPGMAVAYIENGEIAWTIALGQAGPDRPATTDTLWNVASLTKPVTAEVILQLAARGIIDLDQAMSEAYVDPDLAGDARHHQLTPRIALVHQTGFANWRWETGGRLSFVRDPGTQTGYSGEGYTYLARFAEAVTGKSFPELAIAHVLSPLAMGQTSYLPRTGEQERWARPHDESGRAMELQPHEAWSGADNLMTTLGDYAVFLIRAMETGHWPEDIAQARFAISDNQIDEGCPLPAAICPTGVGFGLGWEIFEYADHRVIQHGGADAGERALAYFDEQDRTGAVILTNGANGGKLIARIVEALYPENPAYHALLRLQAGMDPVE